MTLWFVLALMTAAAIFAVLWPLGAAHAARARGSDVAVYRDQLDEIERDRAAGLIGEARGRGRARRSVAPAARGGRCRSAAAAAAWPATAPPARAAVAALDPAAARRGASLSRARLAGAAGPAARGAARRRRRSSSSIAELVAQVEAHLEQNPDDGRGWEVVAPVYMRLGRYRRRREGAAQRAAADRRERRSARPISARR